MILEWVNETINRYAIQRIKINKVNLFCNAHELYYFCSDIYLTVY